MGSYLYIDLFISLARIVFMCEFILSFISLCQLISSHVSQNKVTYPQFQNMKYLLFDYHLYIFHTTSYLLFNVTSVGDVMWRTHDSGGAAAAAVTEY